MQDLQDGRQLVTISQVRCVEQIHRLLLLLLLSLCAGGGWWGGILCAQNVDLSGAVGATPLGRPRFPDPPRHTHAERGNRRSLSYLFFFVFHVSPTVNRKQDYESKLSQLGSCMY